MNKQLLDKIDQALQAQQDTIQRQEQMLESKDKDIAELQSLLKQLTATQTEQIQHLPKLHDSLKNAIVQQSKQQRIWSAQVSKQVKLMNTLLSELMTLSESQIRLIGLMKDYQSTIVPPEELESVTQQLESELSDIVSSQTKIVSKQKSLKEQQQNLQKLLETSK